MKNPFELHLKFVLFVTVYDGYRPSSFATFESQVRQFQDFLLRANKYPTLSIFGGNGTKKEKIILVEVGYCCVKKICLCNMTFLG